VVRLAWAQILEADRVALQPVAEESGATESERPKRRELTEEERLDRLAVKVKSAFHFALRRVIQTRAREKFDVVEGVKQPFTLKAAQAWARKEAATLAATRVAEELGGDGELEAAEVLALFARRRSYEFRRGAYGDGTFIVERSPFPRAKLQTGEAWWSGASASTRTRWLTAYCAEFGGHMTVLRIDHRNCHDCGGRGTHRVLVPGSDRGIEHRPCRRCHGVRHDRTVVYR
jgi:hypothetical protein